MFLKFGLFLLFAFLSPTCGFKLLGCSYCATPSVSSIQKAVYERGPAPDNLLWYLMPTESWEDSTIFTEDCGNDRGM
ncbi:unnamed protein product, partial [Mesorhabditis spiculigera]